MNGDENGIALTSKINFLYADVRFNIKIYETGPTGYIADQVRFRILCLKRRNRDLLSSTATGSSIGGLPSITYGLNQPVDTKFFDIQMDKIYQMHTGITPSNTIGSTTSLTGTNIRSLSKNFMFKIPICATLNLKNLNVASFDKDVFILLALDYNTGADGLSANATPIQIRDQWCKYYYRSV